jgi:hypothetical protein
MGVKVQQMDSPDCGEALHLLDSYLTALSAFHTARRRELLPGDSEWSKLVAARQAYLAHVDQHGCRETRRVNARMTGA